MLIDHDLETYSMNHSEINESKTGYFAKHYSCKSGI